MLLGSICVRFGFNGLDLLEIRACKVADILQLIGSYEQVFEYVSK